MGKGEELLVRNIWMSHPKSKISVKNDVYFLLLIFSGILEANFIKPTHDKQDFEKSVLYQRLEIRLKEMTYEYW